MKKKEANDTEQVVNNSVAEITTENVARERVINKNKQEKDNINQLNIVRQNQGYDV